MKYLTLFMAVYAMQNAVVYIVYNAEIPHINQVNLRHAKNKFVFGATIFESVL